MKGKSQARKKPVQKSVKANITFPVARIARYLREGHFAPNISVQAAVALGAVLENIVFELLDLTVEVVRKEKMLRVFPRHLREALKFDEDLDTFFQQSMTTIGI